MSEDLAGTMLGLDDHAKAFVYRFVIHLVLWLDEEDPQVRGHLLKRLEARFAEMVANCK